MQKGSTFTSREMEIMKKMNGNRLIIILIFSIVFATQFSGSANASSKWNPISSQDYIFGYTSFKYACWSGSFTSDSAPVLQVYENGRWVDVAKGFILPSNSDLGEACESTYPIAVGYQWTFMNPAPPVGLSGGTRYNVLYRQKMPDIVTKVPVLVTKSVPTQITKTRDVTKSVPEDLSRTRYVSKLVKTPYIASVMKNGKKVNVIKYKIIPKLVSENYIETVLVERTITETYIETVLIDNVITETQDKVTAGYISDNGNIAVYPSESAMVQSATALANGLACALGLGTCKKK